MSRTRRPLAAVAGLIAAVLALSACAASASAPTTSGTDLEATGGSAAAASVPLTTSTASGTTRLTVQITVGGGSPITVVLDTGSTGLFVDQSAVGPDTTSSGTAYTEDYVGGKLTSTLATATVGIGDVQTTGAITLGLVDTSTLGDVFTGAQGIMGVAPAEGDAASAGLLSPFIQLAPPYNGGFEVDAAAGGTGTLTLGRPTASAGTVSTPLTALGSTPVAVSGAGWWQKDVSLCWTIAALPSACGPTDLDTGAPTGLLNSTVVTSGVSTDADGALAAGQAIAVATPAGTQLWSVTTGTTSANDEFAVASLGSETSYNTGLGFYFDHVVAFDWVGGTLLVTAD